MTKTEFLTELARELEKRNVADAADIMEDTSSTLPSSWRTATLRRRSPPSWAPLRYWPPSSRRRRPQTAPERAAAC